MCAPVTVAGFVWANFNEKNDNYFIPRRQGYQDQYQCSITTDGKMSEDRECNSKRKSELRGFTFGVVSLSYFEVQKLQSMFSCTILIFSDSLDELV